MIGDFMKPKELFEIAEEEDFDDVEKDKRRDKSKRTATSSIDLRRTFATRAQELGLDITALKRLLNHKRSSRDVTEGYIIMDGVEKLKTVRGYLEDIEKSLLNDEEKHIITAEEIFQIQR